MRSQHTARGGIAGAPGCRKGRAASRNVSPMNHILTRNLHSLAACPSPAAALPRPPGEQPARPARALGSRLRARRHSCTVGIVERLQSASGSREALSRRSPFSARAVPARAERRARESHCREG